MKSIIRNIEPCNFVVFFMFTTFIVAAFLILTITGVLGQVLINGGAPPISGMPTTGSTSSYGQVPMGYPTTGVSPAPNYIQSQGIYNDARPDTVSINPYGVPYRNNIQGNTSNPYTTYSPNDVRITGGAPFHQEPEHSPFFKIEVVTPTIPETYDPAYNRSPFNNNSLIINESSRNTGLYTIKQNPVNQNIRMYDTVSGKYKDYVPNTDGSYMIYNSTTGRYEGYIGNPMQPKQYKDEFYRRNLKND